MGLEAGGVLVLALVLALSLGRHGGVLGPFLVMVGPWCSFLVVVSACCHPLTTQPASRGLQRWEWAGGVIRFVCLLVSRHSFVPLF